MPHRTPTQLNTATGSIALVYPGRDGSLYVEKLGRNGQRDPRGMIQVEADALIAAALKYAPFCKSVRQPDAA